MTRKVYFIVYLLYHLIQLALYLTKLAMAGFDPYHPTHKEYKHIRDICDEVGRSSEGYKLKNRMFKNYDECINKWTVWMARAEIAGFILSVLIGLHFIHVTY